MSCRISQGFRFVEKPPGFQAAIAAVYRTVGEPSTAAARFTAAAFALLSLVAVFLLGWRTLGIEGGGLTVALLAFSQRFCRTAHDVLLDNALAAAIAFTVLFTWIALEATDVRKKRLAYAAAGFSLGVSFLFKGFVGPAIFASGFLLYLIVGRRFGEIRHILRPLSVIAFLVPALAWIVPFLLSAPSHLVREFFIQNHFGRFIYAYDSHKGPIYFYLLIIWLEFAPGSIFLPLAVWMAWKTRKEGENRAGIFFLSLLVGPLVLLSGFLSQGLCLFFASLPSSGDARCLVYRERMVIVRARGQDSHLDHDDHGNFFRHQCAGDDSYPGRINSFCCDSNRYFRTRRSGMLILHPTQ